KIKIILPPLSLKNLQMSGRSAENQFSAPGIALITSIVILILACCLSNLHAADLTLPLTKTFQTADFGTGWTTNVSPESTFKVTDGGINFTAPEHARAFVTHEANADLITFSGKI